MSTPHSVIDIFAGPGGLSEGFAGLALPNGFHPFRVRVSVEMEATAHATLSLRALFRKCIATDRESDYWKLISIIASQPSASIADAVEQFGLGRLWLTVGQEALRLTLGTPSGNQSLRDCLLPLAHKRSGNLVLIGGPPCQAYSLVGRARNRGISGYRAHEDNRHFLYREYLSILSEFQPEIFIMENVPGILSSKVSGSLIFQKILMDLRRPSGRKGPVYELMALANPDNCCLAGKLRPTAPDYVVRSEEFGVPQARHRVIILGVRHGVAPPSAIDSARLRPSLPAVNVEEVLTDLPALRSGLSRSEDSGIAWAVTMREQQSRLVHSLRKKDSKLAQFVANLEFSSRLPRTSAQYRPITVGPAALPQYYRSRHLRFLLNHETRGHMREDLCRYLFCASHAAVHGRSPSSAEFPAALRPAHRSWNTGHFADRFRVQLGHTPGRTVTSHLAKDGHHFIHWDPKQCRSLTVREAARIQTFADNYLFLGNRTQQYVQVGNAVPPLLARQIAAVVAELLG